MYGSSIVKNFWELFKLIVKISLPGLCGPETRWIAIDVNLHVIVQVSSFDINYRSSSKQGYCIRCESTNDQVIVAISVQIRSAG